MGDEKIRNYPVPAPIVDAGYIDDKIKLPKGNFKIEIPSDSFYDFINKPEDNMAEFVDLINGLSAGAVAKTVNSTDVLTPEKFDDMVREIEQKTYSSIGVPVELLNNNSVLNKNGVAYDTKTTLNKSYTTMSTEDADALITEMNLLKEKNDNYLDLIQKQAEALKDKDRMIAKLSDALQKSLDRELNNMSEKPNDECLKPLQPAPKTQVDDLMRLYGFRG